MHTPRIFKDVIMMLKLFLSPKYRPGRPPAGHPLMKPYVPSPRAMRGTLCWKIDDCASVPECPLFRVCAQVASLRTRNPQAPHPHAHKGE